MPRTHHLPFSKNLMAIAVGAALTPSAAWALDLVQEPPLPTSRSAFVAPNVIISVDDSGSMDWGVKSTQDGSSKTGKGYTEPRDDGTWASDAKRINVLRYALKTVFSSEELIPKNKLRLAWQAMHNNGNSSDAGSVNSSSMNTNSMRPIDGNAGGATHRENFLSFVNKLKANNGTPSHKMFSQADAYMRRQLSKNSPWSSDPGGVGSKSTEYLGCRRNYHIMMTDGVWNGTESGGSQDGKNWGLLNDRKAYSTGSDQTRIYYDSYSNTLADWAFRSWMDPLQDAKDLKDSDRLITSTIYQDAPETENYSKSVTTYKDGKCLEKDGRGRCIRYEQIPTTETKSVDLQKYWNPKYNPATWPHMVTYTIGFSEQATSWKLSPDIPVPNEKVPFGYTAGFVDLVTGWATWPDLQSKDHHKSDSNSDRPLDLWHAAINGRGRFYAVTEAEDLAKAFTEIIGKINEESAPLPDSIAGGGSTSGYNVSQNNAGIFASVYSPKDSWSGYITATRAIEPERYACPTEDDEEKKCIRFPDVVAGWEGNTTADRLDALADVSSRTILSWSDSTNAGIPFKWTDTAIGYSAAQKMALLKVTSGDTTQDPLLTQGKNIVNYIRGDHSLEGATTAKPFRVRHSRQGDVVNSEIWYTGGPIGNFGQGYLSFVKAQKSRTPILYVGGNDGMLHGFSARDGSELMAYVPRGVVSNLKDLTDPDYKHKYFVDGSPMTGDIKDSDTWKTLLVGTLGAGGKGYFVLNVTDPATFGDTSTKAAEMVELDLTRGNTETAPSCSALTDAALTRCEAAADMGNITAQPGRNPANMQEATQITRMNNGRWAVVMGNGYNSANQRPVLLVQYLDGDKALVRVQATAATKGSGNANDNGLASPALVDLNGDGKTDVVYAGDNLGNLWKFDLTSSNPNEWKVAFGGVSNSDAGTGEPLFTTRGPATLTGATRGQTQPITAPPIVRPNDRFMLVGGGKDKTSVPVGGMMVAFGTGRNLTETDRRTDITQPIQTLYSVLDNTRYRKKSGQTYLEVHPGSNDCSTKPATCVPTPAAVGTMSGDGKTLAKQQITIVKDDDATVVPSSQDNTLDPSNWSKFKGWYLDLPFSGERLIKPMQFFDGSNILAVYTETPNGTKNSASDNINESCVPVKVDTSMGSQFRTLINIQDGKRPTVQLTDYNADGLYNAADLNVDRMAVPPGTPILITTPDSVVDKTGGGGGRDTLARMPEQSTRPSWRQVK